MKAMKLGAVWIGGILSVTVGVALLDKLWAQGLSPLGWIVLSFSASSCVALFWLGPRLLGG